MLISLNTKKAFVDHKYIKETLIAYGFGPRFIRIFKTLYRNITASILINRFASESNKIERGVKQGYALSCAIFIICIDPLLRNLNKNKRVKEVKLLTKMVPMKKSTVKVQLMQMILVSSVKRAMIAYSKFFRNIKD